MSQKDFATLCPGCFADKGATDPCPNCGYDAIAPRSAFCCPIAPCCTSSLSLPGYWHALLEEQPPQALTQLAKRSEVRGTLSFQRIQRRRIRCSLPLAPTLSWPSVR